MNIFLIVLFVICLLLLIARALWCKQQRTHRQYQATTIRFLQVKIPEKKSEADLKSDHIQGMKQNIELMNQVLKNFTSIYTPKRRTRQMGQNYISLELIVEKEAIKFILWVPLDYIDSVEKTVSSFYPWCVIDIVNQPKLLYAGKYAMGGTFHLTKDNNYPLKTYETFEADPMDSVLSAFGRANGDETLCLQIMVAPLDEMRHTKMRKKIDRIKEGQLGWSVGSVFASIFGGLFDEKDKKSEEKKEKKQLWSSQQSGDLDKKIEDELFDIVMRVVAVSPTPLRPEKLITDFARNLSQYQYMGFNSLEYKETKNLTAFLKHFVDRSFQQFFSPLSQIFHLFRPMILNIKEVSSLFHFPHSKFNLHPRIRRQRYKIVPAPDNIPTEGTLIGYNLYLGVKKEIRLKFEDRFRHFYVIGQTGTGKTTMLLNLAKADLYDNNGFCFIDPHGDFCDDLISYLPKNRINDLIYFNVSDFEYPLWFNIFQASTPEERDVVVSDLVDMFVSMYGHEAFWPRIQDYFMNAAYMLMEQPEGGTVSEIVRVFTDPAYQKLKLQHVTNPAIRNRREKTYASMGDREKWEMIPYFQAKFSPFTTSGIVRNIVGQSTSSFDIGEAMDSKKIILVNLSKGLIGESNSQLIGRCLATQIKIGALRRAKMLEKDRVPFFLYVDEFQNYVSKSFESIMSEARKYRLGLGIAHQYIDQLKSSGMGGEMNLADAIFGNVGNIMSLKVGAKDAEFLEKEFSPDFSQSDLVNMDKRKGIIKISCDTMQTRPFSITPLYPKAEPPLNDEQKIMVIKQIVARKRGREKKFVESEIFEKVGI